MKSKPLGIGSVVSATDEFKKMLHGSARPRINGKIVGESRDKKSWWVKWPNVVQLETIHKDYLQ